MAADIMFRDESECQDRQVRGKYEASTTSLRVSKLARAKGWLVGKTGAAPLPPTNLYECQRKGLTNLHFVSP